MLPQVVLKAEKTRTFSSGHPWVFEKAIDRVEGTPSDGDEVELVTHRGKFVARGIFNHKSRIRVRFYSWTGGEALDEAFWRRRLQSAIALRRQLGYDDPQGTARLVFSEGDGLSGLVVDRYADYLAVQVTSLAAAGERFGAVILDPVRCNNVARTNRPAPRSGWTDPEKSWRWRYLRDLPRRGTIWRRPPQVPRVAGLPRGDHSEVCSRDRTFFSRRRACSTAC
jgi:hypothetical protein